LKNSLAGICLALIFQAVALGQTASTTALTASPSPSNYGQPVTLTATVTSGTTGKVTFYDGVADVQFIVNEALGIVPANNDLNNDGVVNIADVQKVIDAAMNLGCLH
jgi:hypothetical protein